MSGWMPFVLAVVAAGACGDSIPDRPFADLSGVQAEFRPTPTTIGELVGLSYQLSSDAEVRAFALSSLQQAGVRHVRADLLWQVVEPVRGQRDFTAYGADVEAVAAAGGEMLPILCYGNPWANATPGQATVPPDDPADYAAYAGAAAATFHGALSAYEIWNEPNLGFRFWQPREQPRQYGELLTAAATTIRAADPRAQVVLGGLLYHGQFGTDADYFLERMYREHPNTAASYDVLAFHPYKLYPPNTAPELDDAATDEVSLPRMVARLRALLDYYGDDPSRPIWATEIGWPTYGIVDEEMQARWLVRSTLLLAGAGVEREFWYTLFDGPNPTAFPPEDAFGLFRYDDPSDGSFAPTPKLAWQALVMLRSITASLAVTEDVTAELAGAPADAHAYRLADPTGATARRVTVIWRTDDAATPIAVTVPVTPIAVVDLLGSQLPASASVALSGRPVYVIETP